MDNNFDFNSKKYMILLVIVCSLFAILIIKAFDYLPDKNVYISENEKNQLIGSNLSQNIKADENSADNNSENKDKAAPAQKSGVLYKNEALSEFTADEKPDDKIQFEEIDAPKSVIQEETPAKAQNNLSGELTPDESALKSIISAKKYVSAGDNTNALAEYMKAIELTKDPDILAESYDGLAELYAKNKKFGTSLTFATKAYKAAPTAQREFQIAKLYYAAGKTEEAVTRLNNLLKRNINTPSY